MGVSLRKRDRDRGHASQERTISAHCSDSQ
jgi:hypothetical protein